MLSFYSELLSKFNSPYPICGVCLGSYFNLKFCKLILDTWFVMITACLKYKTINTPTAMSCLSFGNFLPPLKPCAYVRLSLAKRVI